MEEKKEIKVRLSTVVYLIIIVALVVTLGVTYYFGFINNNEEEPKIKNEVNNIQNSLESDKNKNEIEDKNNTIKDNETVTVNKSDKAIEELKEALTSQKWIKENLYLSENCFGDKISGNAEQNITFEVIKSEQDAPIIVAQTEVEDENSKQLSIIRYKNDKVKVGNDGPGNSSRVSYEIKDNILISSWAAMGDWSYTVLRIDESSEENIESDEGSMDEEDDGYIELEKVIEKYSAKPISKELNDSNVEKYIK